MVDILKKTVGWWDLKFLRQKRKVATVADISTAHCIINGLKSIQPIFLATKQSLDQSIVQNFKGNYQKLLLTGTITIIDQKNKFQVSVLKCSVFILSEVKIWCHKKTFKIASNMLDLILPLKINNYWKIRRNISY